MKIKAKKSFTISLYHHIYKNMENNFSLSHTHLLKLKTKDIRQPNKQDKVCVVYCRLKGK